MPRKGQGRPLAERLWSRVDKNGAIPAHVPELGPCWIWQGWCEVAGGHGRIGKNGRAAGMMGAHIAAWIVTNGPIPLGLHVCHHCDNPPCVRPSHLFIGTHADNMADMVRKGRQAQSQKTHCPAGHEYTKESFRASRNERRCRTCARRQGRERSEKNRGPARASTEYTCLFCQKNWRPGEGDRLCKRRYCSSVCATEGAKKIRKDLDDNHGRLSGSQRRALVATAEFGRLGWTESHLRFKEARRGTRGMPGHLWARLCADTFGALERKGLITRGQDGPLLTSAGAAAYSAINGGGANDVHSVPTKAPATAEVSHV